MVIVNFAHPLTQEHLRQIEKIAGQKVKKVIDVKTQFDHERSFVEQARELVDKAGLSSTEWQTLPLLINLPSLNYIAALVLAELHGRCGYFPSVLRLKPVPNANPPKFEAAEILNLQAVRDNARARR